MKAKLILPLALGFALFSCNSTSNENPVVKETETVVNEETDHQDEHETIVLNDGKKWIVVPEMMAFIRNMENGVIEFSTKENSTSEEYKQLALLIDENIRELISNCTMEGQAHDELHKWLVPFIALSEQFDAATELKEQEHIYQEFKKSYKTFNVYFK